ncbi:hypothetical protein ACFQZC_14520 [Streptacidiphilus monticola]
MDAPAAALAFCAAGALLLGAVRALAERTAWLAGTARLLLGTLPMALPQGLAALLVALLWAGSWARGRYCSSHWCYSPRCSPTPTPDAAARRTRPPCGPWSRPSRSRTPTPAGTANGSAGPPC